MAKFFLITIHTCENAVFHEAIVRVTNSYVSRDIVMHTLAEEDVPEEMMPLYYTTKELDFKGMIQGHELKRYRFELKREKMEEEKR